MGKKKRKRKIGDSCSALEFKDLNLDCAPELRSPWLATDISGVYIFDSRVRNSPYHHTYGHFQRIVIYNNYMFPYDISLGLN